MKNRVFSRLQQHRTLLISLSAIVIFITTYLLILPAFTLEKDTAKEQGGITVSSEEPEGALSYEGKGFKVMATVEEIAALPEKTTLNVKEIEGDSEQYAGFYEEALKAVKEEGKVDAPTLSFAKFYDMALRSDSKDVELSSPATVTVSFDPAITVKDADHVRILRIKEDADAGKAEAEILKSDDITLTIENGQMTKAGFKADEFAVYAVVCGGEAVKQEVETEESKDAAKTENQEPATKESVGKAVEEMKQASKGILAFTGKDYKINLFYDETAEIPSDVTLKADEITRDTEEYQVFLKNSAVELGVEPEDIAFARFFNIEILDQNGKKIEPKTPVQVKISYDDAIEIEKRNELSIVHFADDKTEIIRDAVLADNDQQVTYQQDSFSVTGTVVSTPVQSHEYAIIIKYEQKYYAVNNDGSLREIEGYSPDNPTNNLDESTIMWSYNSVASINGDGGGTDVYTFRHKSDAYAYTGVGLPIGFVYRYLNVDQDSGLIDVEDDYDPSKAEQYHNLTWYSSIVYDAENHRLSGHGNNASKYIGVSDNNGSLKIAGRADVDHAAEVYLVEAQNIAEVNVRNHTVNHIDISVDGKASTRVPLAYGNYQLGLKDDQGQIITTDQTLTVSKENQVTVDVETVVPITQDDIKQAKFEAFTLYKGQKETLNDVFYVTGYSGNTPGSNATQQVRLEGSFKVSDVPNVPWPNDYNSSEVKAERLEKPIFYSISVDKNVEFTLTYKVDGQEYIILKDGQPFKVTMPATLANTFSYWDEENECPGIDLYGRDNWRQGALESNSWWVEGDGGPGMDFRLGASDDHDHDLVAIEIVKNIQDTDGNMINPADDLTCKFNVYQSNSAQGEATLLHDKTMTVGQDGYGLLFDYDVEGGKYTTDAEGVEHYNPKYAQIAEQAKSVYEFITDRNGDTWIYDHSRVDTEYVWRDFGNPALHVGEEVNKEDGDIFSESEILGEYRWDHYPQHYEYDGVDHDGNEFNRFLEFYVYNYYKKIPNVDVPVEKTWDDFDVEGADWSATLRLQWAPIYEGQTEVGDDFKDVEPVREITITKDMMAQGSASLAARTFENLPKYGYDPERELSYRIQYSVEEMAYTATKDGQTYTFTRSTTPGVPDTYTPEGEDNRFTAFFPHDAGELSPDNDDYYIAVANHPRNSKDKQYIDFDVTKTWDDENILNNDEAFATFRVLYNKRIDYRDVSHMTDADREADPVTVTLKDTNGKVYDTIQVQPHTGIRISVTRKGKTGNSTYTVSGGDYTPSNPWVSPSVVFNYNPDKETKFFDGKAYPGSSCDIVLSGDLDYLDGAHLYDTTPGNVTESGIEAARFTLDKANHWTHNLSLLHEETVAGGSSDNENVEVYEYYLEEVESNPSGYFAKFYEQGTEIEEGDKYNPITSGNNDIEARNEQRPELVVKKAWRGVPDTTGYPTVKFTLYQCKAGTDNVGNAHVYEGEEYPYEGAANKRYENIPLSSSSEAAHDFTWVCPEVLPTRDTNGNRLAYFVVENPDQGNVSGTSWQLYGYSQGYDPETGKLINIALPGQPYNAQLVGNDGTLMIHNKVNRYHEMDVKKQYFEIMESGSWNNCTAAMTKDVVLGFKVIRRVVSKDGNTKITGWQDYGDEMLVGYDSSGHSIESNGENDFHLQYAGLWHWTIHDQGGDLNSEHIGLPLEGFYTDSNGNTIAVNYQYSFRETKVYKDLDRTPYPDWTWYSTIVPDRYMNQNGGQVEGEFGLQFPDHDGERVANYQASDLLVNKRWLGQPTAQEVYVKIWRQNGDNEPEDFTKEIADDVAGRYPESHPAHGNTNWQGFVEDPSEVDTDNNWLILKSNSDGKWETHVKVLNALIKTTGTGASNYTYYIEEVGYKDKDGVVHIKPEENLSELESHYTRWIHTNNGWEVSPSTNGADKSIQLGATGENRLLVMNAPEMDLKVKKAWVDEDGNPRDAWQDSITFQIEQVCERFDVNGEPTGETKTALVKINGNSTFTMKKVAENAHWIINVNHDQHDQYTVDREDSRTNDTEEPWTFYVDGLQEGYFDANNDEWHCTYNVKEVNVPKSEVTITGNEVSTNGQTVAIENKYSYTSAVKISKIFSGIDALPESYKITASWTDGNEEHSIDLTISEEQPENVTLTGNGSVDNPYVWTISKLPIRDPAIEVKFTESGYEVEDAPVTVTSSTDSSVSNDHPVTTISVAEDQINQGNFTNTYGSNTVDITILKEDSETKAKISDAKFSLHKADAEDGTYAIVTEIDGVTLDENSWFTVPVDGVVLNGLDKGFYRIVEEKAPAGYTILDNTPVRFEVTSDGSVVNKSIDSVTYESEEHSFTVPNEPGKELPFTGGSGTRLYLIMGSIMTLGASLLLLKRRKRVTS